MAMYIIGNFSENKEMKLLLLCFLCLGTLVTQGAERILFTDDFSAGKLNFKKWRTNHWRIVDGKAVSGKRGGVLFSKMKFGKNRFSVYTLDIYGYKTEKPGTTSDNWWGLVPDVKNYKKGVDLRLYKTSLITNVWMPHKNRTAESYHKGFIIPGQEYDFRMEWQPGKLADFFFKTKDMKKWKKFVNRRFAPKNLQIIFFMSPAQISIKGIKLTEQYDEVVGNKEATLSPEMKNILVIKKKLSPRFPIGFWNYVQLATDSDRITKSEVEDWAKIGATVMLSPENQPGQRKHVEKIKQILSWCEEVNIKMIVSDRRSKVGHAVKNGLIPADYKDKIKKVYDDYKSSPAFLGLFVADEPSGKMIPRVIESIKQHREVSPEHHPFMNWWAFWPEWNMHGKFASPADFLVDYAKRSKSTFIIYDNYSQCWPGKYGIHPAFGETGWAKHFLNLIHFRLASLKTGIPFWATLNCVDHMNYVVDKTTLEWQFNTAICAGASGVMWFYYYARNFYSNGRNAPVDALWEKTQRWYDLRKIHLGFKKKYGDLFNNVVNTRLMFYGKTFSGGKTFTGNGLIAGIKANKETSPKNLNLQIGEFADASGKRYVMIVNLARERSVRLDISFPGTRANVYAFRDGREIALRNMTRKGNKCTTRAWLAPAGEIVFRVDSAAAAYAPITVETPPSDNCPACRQK
jgi:hypothetical protein